VIRCSTCDRAVYPTPTTKDYSHGRLTVGIVMACNGCGATACKGDVPETMRKAVQARGGAVLNG
jgi:hypothetical protein